MFLPNSITHVFNMDTLDCGGHDTALDLPGKCGWSTYAKTLPYPQGGNSGVHVHLWGI